MALAAVVVGWRGASEKKYGCSCFHTARNALYAS